MSLGLSDSPKNPHLTVNGMVMGWFSKSVAGGSDVTLQDPDECNYASFRFTGALTASINVKAPDEAKIYVVHNNTSGAYTLTFKTLTGVGISVQQGKKAVLYSDGTDIIRLTVDTIASIIDGELIHDMASDANYTLSTSTDPQEWQYETVKITDTSVNLTAARDVIVPTTKKLYVFINSTLQTLTLKVSGQSGVAVGAGKTAFLRCNGTDVERLAPDLIKSVKDVAISIANSDANYTLSTSTDPEEWQYEMIEITGALTGPVDIVCPTNIKEYKVYNNTTGGFSLWFKVSGQTGIEVTNAKRAILWCDGTDIERMAADA